MIATPYRQNHSNLTNISETPAFSTFTGPKLWVQVTFQSTNNQQLEASAFAFDMPEASDAPGESAPLLQTVQRSDGAAGEPLLRDSSNKHTTVVIGDPEICHSPTHSRHLHTSASQGSNAASCSSNSPVLGTCRICFDTETAESQDPANPLICPCLCSGGSKYVHRQCLAQWRNTNHRADAFYQCEVCKYRCGLVSSPVLMQQHFCICMECDDCTWLTHPLRCTCPAVGSMRLVGACQGDKFLGVRMHTVFLQLLPAAGHCIAWGAHCASCQHPGQPAHQAPC